MTEKELNQYKAIKTEIADLNRRIKDTKEGEGNSNYYKQVLK